MFWGRLVNFCGEIILSNNKYSFNYREYISLKTNLFSLQKFGGILGVCVYSFFSSPFLNASLYSWECKKNRSYFIEEREFVDAKDRLKKFPTKFLSNLDKQSKIIVLRYDLGKGIATINGNSATITGFPKANQSFKEMPQQSLVISSFLESRSDSNVETLFAEDIKAVDKEIAGSSINEIKQSNFLLNTQIDTANFVFTELNEIVEEQYKTKRDILKDTIEIEELIEISMGKCRLLSEDD